MHLAALWWLPGVLKDFACPVLHFFNALQGNGLQGQDLGLAEDLAKGTLLGIHEPRVQCLSPGQWLSSKTSEEFRFDGQEGTILVESQNFSENAHPEAECACEHSGCATYTS